jgi:hypothetical protein
MIWPPGKTSIRNRPPLISSTTFASRWAAPSSMSSAGVQAVDIRHWTLGCAMTVGSIDDGGGSDSRDHAACLGDEPASFDHHVAFLPELPATMVRWSFSPSSGGGPGLVRGRAFSTLQHPRDHAADHLLARERLLRARRYPLDDPADLSPACPGPHG